MLTNTLKSLKIPQTQPGLRRKKSSAVMLYSVQQRTWDVDKEGSAEQQRNRY